MNDGVIDVMSALIKQSIEKQLSYRVIVPYQRVFDSITDLSASLLTVSESVMKHSIS